MAIEALTDLDRINALLDEHGFDDGVWLGHGDARTFGGIRSLRVGTSQITISVRIEDRPRNLVDSSKTPHPIVPHIEVYIPHRNGIWEIAGDTYGPTGYYPYDLVVEQTRRFLEEVQVANDLVFILHQELNRLAGT